MKLRIIILVFLFSCSEKHSTKQKESNENDSTNKNIQVEKSIKIDKDSVYILDCIHKDLSYEYDFKINFKRISLVDYDSCIIQTYIRDKKTQKILDSIEIKSNHLYETVFKECENTRSFITGKNKDKEVVDNDNGDFIIADFNFDNKNDIAIINDSGGNGGVFYNYYIQDKNHKFLLDKYLTDSMIYFPEINNKQKMLITYVHAGVCGLGEHKYIYNKMTNSWKEKSHEIKNICNE